MKNSDFVYNGDIYSSHFIFANNSIVGVLFACDCCAK